MNINLGTRILARFLMLVMLGTSIAAPANAALVSTEQAAGAVASADASAERARIQDWLAREDVARQMQSYGVSTEEAQQRVAALTDEEARNLAGKLDELPAGGGILGVLFAVFIILLITDILGLTKVFPFTRSVR
jgi:hypothetical protein